MFEVLLYLVLSSTKIVCFKGLNQNGNHGFHIDEYADLTDGCATTCVHFNPYGKKHGRPWDQQKHVGNLGNVAVDPFENAYYCFKDNKISIYGDFSLVGRTVVLHAVEDDLGKKGDEYSLKTGNAGPRMACGVIGLVKQFQDTHRQMIYFIQFQNSWNGESWGNYQRINMI